MPTPGTVVQVTRRGGTRPVCVICWIDDQKFLAVRVDYQVNLGYSTLVVPVSIHQIEADETNHLGRLVEFEEGNADLCAVPLQASEFTVDEVVVEVGRIRDSQLDAIWDIVRPYLA